MSDEDQRCAFIIGAMQPGLQYDFPLLQPNFPQHKVAICVEKKGGQLTIASLESMPSPGINDTIDPGHLTNNLWEGSKRSNAFNPQELVFRAILKACRYAQSDARLLHSVVERQQTYGCGTFALLDGLAFLCDPDFFDKITCSKDTTQIDAQYQIEDITGLPPELMIGVQSNTLLQAYTKSIDADQPLIHKKKTFQGYLDAHQVETIKNGVLKTQNHYIIKKAYKYLILLVESLNNLSQSEIKQIIDKTLITKVNEDLLPISSIKSKFADTNIKYDMLQPECALISAKEESDDMDQESKPIHFII